MDGLKLFALLIAAAAGPALAQNPYNTVQSDSHANTAMGTYAIPNPPTGYSSTAAGEQALGSLTTGSYNAAFGAFALQFNAGSYGNTALGFEAMNAGESGMYNTAVGYYTMANGVGSYNTTVGYSTMIVNQGSYNTATGQSSLEWNTTGNYNTALGSNSLNSNTSGSNNTATGYQALYSNTSAGNNTATGHQAMYKNATGAQNAASGAFALFANTSGLLNTAVGFSALYSNTVGNYNIAIGENAGYSLTTGSENIDIGNAGKAGDNHAIKIGTQGTQTSAYIAGIYGTSMTGSAVVINSSGQLGVTSSSERFKTAIAPMGIRTSKLEQLRPVTFHLRSEPQGALQYGLIAEEVDKIYPELVIRSAEGRIDGVRYDELAPMLLNEVQRLEAKVDEQATQLQQMHQLKLQVAALQAAMAKLADSDRRVASR
jgi:hypothetical protein